jgi:hypothetical protein
VLATRVLDTSTGVVAVDLVDGHVHEITVAGEHGLETLGQGVFEEGFDRSEEASAADVWSDWRGPHPSPALPLAASSLAPTHLLLALFGIGFLGLGALVWYFLTLL